jgi:hypothetical protein
MDEHGGHRRLTGDGDGWRRGTDDRRMGGCDDKGMMVVY